MIMIGDMIAYVGEHGANFSNYDDDWEYTNSSSFVDSVTCFIIIDIVDGYGLHRERVIRCIDSRGKKRVFIKDVVERLIDDHDTWKRLT